MNRKISPFTVLEWLLPWFILSILGLFTYAKFYEIPYLGFTMSNGIVRNVYDYIGDYSTVKAGDQIILMGTVNMDAYKNDLEASLLGEFDHSSSIQLEIEREGQTNFINWIIPGPTVESVLTQLIGIWWISYVFWLAGTVTILFHRPKDGIWLRLIAIYYLTAIILIVSAGPSGWHIWKSAIILRSTIWLALPLFIQFHWDFPKSLYPLPTFFWLLMYILGTVLAIVEWFQILPINTYLISLYLIFSGSILLLIAHYIFQSEQRKKLGLFNDAIFIIAVPITLIRLANLSGLHLPDYSFGGAFLAFPSIPGAYFIVSYWDQILSHRFKIISFFQNFLWIILSCSGTILMLAILENFFWISIPTIIIGIIILSLSLITTTISFTPFLVIPTLPWKAERVTPQRGKMQLRANRLISSLLFIIVIGFLYSLILVNGIAYFDSRLASIFIGIVVTLSAVMITILWYPQFNRFIERNLLKIDIPFFNILQSYIDGISNSLDYENLAKMLTKKILPSLLIRESALLYYIERQINLLFAEGIDTNQIPRSYEIINHLTQSIEDPFQRDKQTNTYAWIKLVIPLRVNQKLYGVWLFGKKDPDDFYNEQEINILKSIANQTAIALANIQHKERIYVLLQHNIHHAEEERRKLARDLHDEILNGLVVLGMTLDDHQISPRFEKQFTYLTSRIRRLISGLRPPSLDQGLWFALQEKASELQLHAGNKVMVDFDVPYSDIRYPHNIESQIYRIIQQACDNALLHAKAKNIHVFGELSADKIMLRVEDDGRGFLLDEKYQETPDNELRHYGLTVMEERAELIGADFSIHSTPQHGTSIQLSLNNLIYQKNEHQARIKAEQALFEREKSFREFLATSSFGILLHDENLKIIYANKQAAKITGFSIPELLKRSICELVTHDEYQKILANYQNDERFDISGQFIETKFQNKNFEVIPIEMTMTKTLWNGQYYGLIIFSDITTKKQIEDAYKKSNENIYKIFDNAIDGIVLVDKNGKHLYVNTRYAEMVGYSRPELLEKSMEDMFHQDEIAEAVKRLEDRLSRTGAISPYEVRLKKKNGNFVPIIGVSTIISWQGEDVVMGLMRDISIQKQAEEALHYSEQKFRTLVENAQEGILVSDDAGKHIYANLKAAEISEYTLNELSELSYLELAHPSHIDGIRTSIKKSIAGEKPSQLTEARIISKMGKTIPVEYSVSSTIWEGQRGFIIVFRDIIERKRIEESLKSREETFKSIVDDANDGILVAGESGKYIYANRHASEITGYKIVELLETSIEDLFHPDVYMKIKSRFDTRISGRSAPIQYQIKIITKRGDTKDIEITAAQTNWDHQSAVIVIMRDISSR